jgi:hypothetical protein
MSSIYSKVLVTALGLAGLSGPAQAVLTDVDPGPYTAATGFFPLYYTDATPTTLDLCLSKAQSTRVPGAPGAPSYMCTLLPNPGVFDDAEPIVFPVNFPDEAFWFTADAAVNDAATGVNLSYTAALEAAFGGGLPAPGDQISFARIRIRADIPEAGTYVVTHPYGVETFVVTTPGVRAINMTRDIGIGAPGVFTGALRGDIGPFLRSANGPYDEINPETGATETFIGDPNLLEPVTGGPNGNVVSIARTQGGSSFTLSTDLFSVSGRIWNGQRPTAVTVDRSSYSRTLAAGTRLDVFATSSPTAALSFRQDLPLGVETPMTADGAGQFHGHAAPPTAPPFVIVTASEPAGPTTPTPLASPVVDVVKITRAEYARDTRTLIIEATSSDEVSIPSLRTVGFSNPMAVVPGTATLQRLQATRAEPPATVTVVSSSGGRDTEPVVVVAAAPVNQAPVAVADTATTAEDTAVNIAVLANDSDPDGDTLAVSAVTGVTGGSAIPNASGAVTFTPAPNFNGTAGFSYTVVDGRGGVASATVSVTVTSVNDPPSAVADAATTTFGNAVTILVLANDSDPDGNLLTVSAVTNGANGTVTNSVTSVTYTPNTGFAGTDTFTYTASDGQGGTATANVSVVVQPGVDYDISRFTVSNNVRVGRAGTISLRFTNASTVQQLRTATVTGVQAGNPTNPFYRQSLQISAAPGRTVTVSFPGFVPTQIGTITWTAEIFDDNPDGDRATATTTVAR